MNCGRMSLYPDQYGDGCMRMPLFSGCGQCSGGWNGSGRGECQSVRLYNPRCQSEYADVELCVDACGNLSICVHRPSQNCCERRTRCRRY